MEVHQDNTTASTFQGDERSIDDTVHVSSVTPPPAYPVGSRRKLAFAAMLILAGMASLAMLAMAEAAWRNEIPWSRAMAGPEAGTPDSTLLRAKVRTVPLDNFPEQAAVLEELNALELPDVTEQLEDMGFARTEALLLAPAPREAMEGMLLEGRLPEHGKPEVLAGDLSRLDAFTVDNVQFTVTGRARPGVGVLTFTYLLPEHPAWQPLFDGASDTVNVWIAPEGGKDPLQTLVDSGLLRDEERDDPAAMQRAQDAMLVYEGSHLHAMTRTNPGFGWGAWVILIAMLTASAIAHTQFFLLLRPRAPRVIRALLDHIALHLRSWYVLHAVAYGAFAGAMAVGMLNPLGNMQMIDFVRAQFSDGGLAYIGEAYASGDIVAAANATWTNNFLVQTFGLTALISLPPLALGFFKTLISLAVVGFAMAPAWTGVIDGYVLHSGTMVLELAPYILVCHVVVVWPLWFLRGLFVTRDFSARAAHWTNLLLQSLFVSGALLYLAALYEAVTLITLMGLG
ncbi:MAG: hypothetical protein RLZZ303_3345 [Candidatus Hydrogenedentota bacterium]|jgi:hypothetical protein